MAWDEIDFDRTLAILRSWLGREVFVHFDNAAGPSGVAGMRGTLGEPAQRAMDEDGSLIDEDMFELVLDDDGARWFNVYRGGNFDGAHYDAKRENLQVGVGHDGMVTLVVEPLDSSGPLRAL